MKTLIVVPARYGSKRFPGKPLADIAGRSMVSRVAVRAAAAARRLTDASAVVATDDQRIADHIAKLGLSAAMTDPALASGSDRALAAADRLDATPDIIVNLQGDAPFVPVQDVIALVRALENSGADAATPTVRLDWSALDELRTAKQTTPFSGTTAIVDAKGEARWFSKQIIPAIRDEALRRERDAVSPVRRHIGLYAFRTAALRRFAELPPSFYEATEGLEQLRLIENGMSIACVDVEAPTISTGGIDTPDDLARLEAMLARFEGDPDTAYFDELAAND